MATNIVPFEVPQHVLAELMGMFPDHANNDLTEGVAPTFAVVTYRGKVWRVRYKGEDRVIKTAEGDPVSSIIAVIVKSSPAVSKIYYPKAYSEGDDAPPLCFSLDGVRPDVSAVEQQSPTCAACPHNVFGSRITEGGKKAKACTDNRRVAVVPYPDLKNDSFGGPMLLRIPTMSLPELWKFGNALKQSGLPYQAVVVKISFDTDAAYPKLLFQAVRPLSKEEAATVREHMDSDAVNRMLMEPVAGDETGVEEEATSGAQPSTGPRPASEVGQRAAKAAAAPAAAPKAEKPKEEPKEEKVSKQATNGVTDDLGAGVVIGEPEEEEAQEETPPAKPKAETKKASPAKAAAAPADVVNSDLNAMITGLLGA